MKDNSSYFYLATNLSIGLLLTVGVLVLINHWVGIKNLWALVIIGMLAFGIIVTLEERFLSKYVNGFVQWFLKK